MLCKLYSLRTKGGSAYWQSPSLFVLFHFILSQYAFLIHLSSNKSKESVLFLHFCSKSNGILLVAIGINYYFIAFFKSISR